MRRRQLVEREKKTRKVGKRGKPKESTRSLIRSKRIRATSTDQIESAESKQESEGDSKNSFVVGVASLTFSLFTFEPALDKLHSAIAHGSHHFEPVFILSIPSITLDFSLKTLYISPLLLCLYTSRSHCTSRSSDSR